MSETHPETRPPTTRELLKHRPWVQALARSLADNTSAADDLEQEVWIRTLSHPPRNSAALRGWFRRATRHTWLDIRKSNKRRTIRETTYARNVESVHKARTPRVSVRLHQDIVYSVCALPNPYRLSILMHYFEGMSTSEIANALDAPIETVRTRIRRGRTLLRLAMSDEMQQESRAQSGHAQSEPAPSYPKRRNWATALFGVARGNLRSKGALSMLTSKLLSPIGVIALLLGLAAAIWVFTTRQGMAPNKDLALSSESMHAETSSTESPHLEIPEVDATSKAPTGLATPSTSAVDPKDHSPKELAYTPLKLVPVPERWNIRPLSPRMRATAFNQRAKLPRGEGRVQGVVRDATGVPMANANIYLVAPQHPVPDAVRVRNSRWVARTGDDGTYDAKKLPNGTWWLVADVGKLSFEKRSYFLSHLGTSHHREIQLEEQHSVEDFELTLSVRAQDLGTLRGRVLMPNGAPRRGAGIGVGNQTIMTNENGEFEALHVPLDGVKVTAGGGGLVSFSKHLKPREDQAKEIIKLTYANEGTLEQRVRVVDDLGQGVPGMKVILSCRTKKAIVHRDDVTDASGLVHLQNLPGELQGAKATIGVQLSKVPTIDGQTEKEHWTLQRNTPQVRLELPASEQVIRVRRMASVTFELEATKYQGEQFKDAAPQLALEIDIVIDQEGTLGALFRRSQPALKFEHHRVLLRIPRGLVLVRWLDPAGQSKSGYIDVPSTGDDFLVPLKAGSD